MNKIHQKIVNSINQMLTDAIIRLEYYGEFCQFVNFKEEPSIGTLGVNVNLDGMNFYYCVDFIESLTQEEVNFSVLHEIFHLLWDHQSRIRRGGYDEEISNIVQDMIINHIILHDVIEFIRKKPEYKGRQIIFATVPKDRDNEICVYMKPDEYKGELIFEEMYGWFVSQLDLYKKWIKDGMSYGCPVSEYMKKIIEDLLSNSNIKIGFDKHMISNVPDEYKKDIVENVKSILRERGLETNDIKSVIGKLSKQKKDYTKEIKISTNELFGSFKERSITKRNRRSIPGVKGKRKESFNLNVILDTSASMDGYFEVVLSYVFQNDITLNIVQIDTEVKDFIVIKNKKQLENIVIKGHGGTKLQKAVDYIAGDKKLNNLSTLVLTDGLHERNLDFSSLKKKVLILSVGKITNVIGDKVKIILIKDDTT